MRMEPEPKKMKVDRLKPPPRRSSSASTTIKKDATPMMSKAQTVMPISMPMINGQAFQNNVAHLKIQQAKNFAVEQARRDGCMGSFKILDSPYGNFLLPVIPTRADLGG